MRLKTKSRTNLHQVVIVGGGAGGLELATRLGDKFHAGAAVGRDAVGRDRVHRRRAGGGRDVEQEIAACARRDGGPGQGGAAADKGQIIDGRDDRFRCEFTIQAILKRQQAQHRFVDALGKGRVLLVLLGKEKCHFSFRGRQR